MGVENKENEDLADEMEQKFQNLFNKLFHKAFGEREKRFEMKFTKLLGDKLEEIVTQLQPKKEEDKKEDSGKDTKVPAEIQALIAQAQKEAKEARDLVTKYQKEAEDHRTKLSRAEEVAQLTQLLTGSVKPALLDMVVTQLHSRVTRDENSGAILWKSGDELLPLKDGLEEWKKSDAGKEVAPPRPVSGSGSGAQTHQSAKMNPNDFSTEHLGTLLTQQMGRR